LQEAFDHGIPHPLGWIRGGMRQLGPYKTLMHAEPLQDFDACETFVDSLVTTEYLIVLSGYLVRVIK